MNKQFKYTYSEIVDKYIESLGKFMDENDGQVVIMQAIKPSNKNKVKVNEVNCPKGVLYKEDIGANQLEYPFDTETKNSDFFKPFNKDAEFGLSFDLNKLNDVDVCLWFMKTFIGERRILKVY